MPFDPLRPDWQDCEGVWVTDAAVVDGDAARIPTSAGDLRVTLHDFGARLRAGEERSFDYGMIAGDAQGRPLTIAETDDDVRLEGAGHTLTIAKKSLAFTLFKGERLAARSATDGHFVRPLRLPPFARADGGWLVHVDLQSHEPIYGLGEKWGPLNKRGQLVHSYNHDALGVNAEASYKNAPFAWSPQGWGVFCHTPAPVLHGVGFAPWSQRAYGLLCEDACFDLFLLTGDSGRDLIAQYTALTGLAPTPPDWSLGVIMSRAYYRDADELLATAKELRARAVPCDTITLDGRAWLDTDTRFSFEWDKERFPEPADTLARLRELNFKVCVWEYPLVSVQNPLFHEMSEKGWLLKDQRTGETFRYQWDAEPFGDV
ncbi:MAG: hypothetical protein MI723_06325, partial [Caulobacterales bacterium]|nr:hypothetical protein [Caulobacterales bacterium]